MSWLTNLQARGSKEPPSDPPEIHVGATTNDPIMTYNDKTITFIGDLTDSEYHPTGQATKHHPAV